MLQQPAQTSNGKAAVKFPGIVADAKALGIRRETLWRYLNGDWPFPAATKRRYNALKRAQKKGAVS